MMYIYKFREQCPVFLCHGIFFILSINLANIFHLKGEVRNVLVFSDFNLLSIMNYVITIIMIDYLIIVIIMYD